jgi:hypothetical protein
MKAKLFGALAALVVYCLGSSLACASTIVLDFEDGIQNGLSPVHNYTVGGFQFIFSDAYYDDRTTFASFFPWALSGHMAITQFGPLGNFPPIVVSFSLPVTDVSIRVLGGAPAANVITSFLRAYGPGDVLLASDSYTNDNIIYSGLLSVSAPDIVKVELDGQLWFNSDNGIQASFDDLTVTPTPLPAALPLFATGLGALGLLARRRKRKQIATA